MLKGLDPVRHPQDGAPVTDDEDFPGGFTGLIYDRLALFYIGEQRKLTAELGALLVHPGRRRYRNLVPSAPGSHRQDRGS